MNPALALVLLGFKIPTGALVCFSIALVLMGIGKLPYFARKLQEFPDPRRKKNREPR